MVLCVDGTSSTGRTGKLFLEFEFSQQLLVVSVYDFPESLPVFSGQRLPLESDLQGLIWESEPVDSDLWKSCFQQVFVYRLLKRHQLLGSRHVVAAEKSPLGISYLTL